MTNIPKDVTLKNIRRELLYFGIDKVNQEDKTILAYTFNGIMDSITLEDYERDEGVGKGDRNAKQIVFLLMRYLMAIFMFSIHRLQLNEDIKNKYQREIEDYQAIFKKFNITFTGSQEDLWIMRDLMTSSSNSFYSTESQKLLNRSTTPKDFYKIMLKSKPLIYLLFYFTGYGGSPYLIKDFKTIAQQVEEKSYQKQQFIKQSSVALYKEDFLLTMMLEPLSAKVTPESLVHIYNKHLNYYNGLLKKDKEKGLSLKITKYNPNKAYADIKTEVAPEATLFPPNYYSEKLFPDFVTKLTKNEKEKVINIISLLYNLDFDKNSLQESIKRLGIDSNITRVQREYERFQNAQVEENSIRSWEYFVTDDKDFLALQAFWSTNKDLHLVFNKRIIDILNQFNVPHPFIYVDIY
ncbi:hypothetical protein HZY88_04710 [Aerococcaceae bacterium DSM 111176]|nr:hypothetical protein [Aerococcaceae bacterium DSM 111176]